MCATQSFPAIVFLSCLFVLMQKTFNLRMDYIIMGNTVGQIEHLCWWRRQAGSLHLVRTCHELS